MVSNKHDTSVRSDARTTKPADDGTEATGNGSRRSSSISAPAFLPVRVPNRESTLLNSLDPEEGARHRQEIESVELPEPLAALISDTDVLNDRPLFTWKWIYRIFGEELTLAAVPANQRQTAQETKFLAGVYITMLDDLAERRGDAATFWQLAAVAYPGQTPEWDSDEIDTAYARCARRVWTALEERLESAPNYRQLRDPYLFDLRSCFQAMDYARVANESYGLMNPREIWRHETDAIGILGTVGADLLFVPSLTASIYRTVRPLLLEAQYLWRLGNWLITWRREAYEGDHTAVLFAEALRNGLITEADLAQLDGDHPAVADRVVRVIEESDLETALATEWERRHDQLEEHLAEVDGIDLGDLHADMEWLMRSHLATEGER